MSEDPKPSWTKSGENILSPEKLRPIRQHLDDVGSIAVLHWHYYGSRAPTPLAFGDYDGFEAYLKKEVQAGDAIDVYPFPHQAEPIARGKFPDREGRVPVGGAY